MTEVGCVIGGGTSGIDRYNLSFIVSRSSLQIITILLIQASSAEAQDK